MSNEAKNTLSFLKLAGQIKRSIRTGWQLKGVANPESVSDHMYRMALMSFLIPSSLDIDKERVMKLSLIHDLAESIVGDITPFCGISKEEKYQKEKNAMDLLCTHLSADIGQEIMELWNEYSEQKSSEAKLTKDFDRFEMILQAYEYENEQCGQKALQDFFDSSEDKINSPLVANWRDELKQLREKDSSNDIPPC